MNNRWLLPEGIEEVLPDEARRIEYLRRRLLDLYQRWGYELVMPPFIEYLESLLTGTGNDLDLQTFKLTDQLTGRMMGVRADMTPQVARIDAHQLKRDVPARLCYMGTVLHTRADGFAGSRSPLQVGVELYGHAGIESDLEVLQLMVATLAVAGITEPYLDLGNTAIYRGLARQAGFDAEQEEQLYDMLQRKSVPELDALLESCRLDADMAAMLRGLVDLNGGDEVLGRAREVLAGATDEVRQALAQLEAFAARAREVLPGVPLHFDLSELRGYNYHTGMVYGAFVPGQGQAIALGGRYDDIGADFGRARPATGFSTDLRTLLALGEVAPEAPAAIFAPAETDAGLETAIARLREAGETVVRGLPGQEGDAAAMGCSRRLVKSGRDWVVAPD
ncbi:MAG TPA: ATP phosphoribosyltransferase regulatory subunit [Gammaproteobacteria bacterium]|nr:ATP phosphoribosyltransferase regulatory subunit [Gammaproteobacteria bacterium]